MRKRNGGRGRQGESSTEGPFENHMTREGPLCRVPSHHEINGTQVCYDY